jgi:hypothetical protein
MDRGGCLFLLMYTLMPDTLSKIFASLLMLFACSLVV